MEDNKNEFKKVAKNEEGYLTLEQIRKEFEQANILFTNKNEEGYLTLEGLSEENLQKLKDWLEQFKEQKNPSIGKKEIHLKDGESVRRLEVKYKGNEKTKTYECENCGTTIKADKTPKKCSCGSGEIKRIKETPQFAFDSSDINVSSLEDLQKIVEKNFPEVWFETKVCLSICASMSLKNLNGCPSLNLVGAPSGNKTTVLSFFYGNPNTYISDDFTPRSFVSNSANISEDELEEVDLLPRIKNKILITPELAPMFEAPKEKMVDNFSMLTRVLDGEGLNRDSGVHGHRGYSGDYKFAWLGATTPLRSAVWKIMGKMGNRLFFLNMRDKNHTENDLVDMFKGKAFEEKTKECRGAVSSFLSNYFQQYPVRSVEWESENDVFVLQYIAKYAKLLSKLRASLMTWKSEEKGQYEYSFPIIEEPPRAMNSLYNIAKGHALINGRKFLRNEDLEPVKAVAFSSMPHDRNELLKLLAKHDGKLTTGQIEKELQCSQDTALRTMQTFEALGIVEYKKLDIEDKQGRPMKFMEIKPEFKEVLRFTHEQNFAIKGKSQENNPAENPYESFNEEDLAQKMASTQGLNYETKPLSQENNPAEKLDYQKIPSSHDLTKSDGGRK